MTTAAARNKGKLTVGELFGSCFCEFPNVVREEERINNKKNSNSDVFGVHQFIQLHGVEYISLGAVASELTPAQRVRDTIEQLTERTKRLIEIGYVVNTQITNTIPLERWDREYPDGDSVIIRPLEKTIQYIQDKEFDAAVEELRKDQQEKKKYHFLKKNNNNNNNSQLIIAGITSHNIAVLNALSNNTKIYEKDALPIFREALALKREAFGEDHPELAKTLDEIGIQLFAKERFDEAMESFVQAKNIRTKFLGTTHPLISMVLNNIACCLYHTSSVEKALQVFLEARTIQTKMVTEDDLDLLHVAITLGNLGYLLIQLKRYEEAREYLEEALLLQQSVLEDGHAAIQDTLSNLEFTNAFHS